MDVFNIQCWIRVERTIGFIEGIIMKKIELIKFEEDIPLLDSWLTDEDLMFIWTAHRFSYPLDYDEFKAFMKEPLQEYTGVFV